ncbi:MAG: D-alanyl-D-alanine carboxypeptidase family protein [Bacillota bacterium]|nr:D-alanyl-D-alanine carboxypeptidase family protein [Bacillota bacterium]
MPRAGRLRRGGLALLALAWSAAAALVPLEPAALAADAPVPPRIEAPSAVLMDAASGVFLYEKNPHQRRAPASVTKLMTLDLIMQALDSGQIRPDETVTASAYAASWGGSNLYMYEGEQLPVKDLLYAVAVASANDAAVALAEKVGGTYENFVRMMNEKARQLGMRDTRYANVHGLPGREPHYTSAYDQALLARHILLAHPSVTRYTRTWEYWVRKGQKNQIWLTNTNRGVIEYPGMDGLKTGWTSEAGFCLVATAERNGQRLIAVVMGAPTAEERNREIYRLLDYGFNSFRTVVVARQGQTLAQLPVDRGTSATLPVASARDVVLTLPRTERQPVRRELHLASRLRAPVRRGQQVGRLEVFLGRRRVEQVPLLAARDVPAPGLWQSFRTNWSRLWP